MIKTIKIAMLNRMHLPKKNNTKLTDVIITNDNLVGFVYKDGSYRCMTPKVASQGS